MATESIANGSTANDGLTAAEKLMKEHTEHEAHKASVEDVVDEDTIQHPPPSAAPSQPISTDPSRVATPSADDTMSSKAAGKQPAMEAPAAAGANKPSLDVANEELFPSLGAPKKAAAPSPWSSKPAAIGKAANGIANGNNASNAPSRTSNPGSGIMTPGSTAASQGGALNLPGRNVQTYQLPTDRMTPRNQLKKPVKDILRDVNKRSKAKVELKEGPLGHVTLVGSGPTNDVQEAFKEVVGQLCGRQAHKVPVPASVRGKIVGKQGATIQAISKRTGAKINISKQEAAEILEDEDLDTTIDVTIEGDVFAVEQAKKDIERIVNEHTSTLSTKLRNIPAEYYPFLAAQQQHLMAQQQGRNLNLQIPHYQNWNQQAVPQLPANGQPAAFVPQANMPIQLSGDRQVVADAKAELERQVAELQRQLTLLRTQQDQTRHQFIVGDRGSSLQDFLADTGCSVILPPPGENSDDIYIVGPPDRVEAAQEKIFDQLANLHERPVDIAKQHQNQAHARDVSRYLQQRQALKTVEQKHNVSIVGDGTGNFMVYGNDGKDVLKAQTELRNIVAGHPPSRFQPVDVDPFYHSHLRQQAAQQIRDTHGVRLIVPEDSDNSPVLLVFEDRAPSPEYELPTRQPAPQDAQTFQSALQEAQQQILNLVNGHQDIVSRDVEAPAKFHDKIRRHVDRHHQGLPGQLSVQVNYGRQQQGQRNQASNVSLRGPQDFVDALNASLLAFIEQEHKDELERGFTLTFDFPQKFANHLIGRRGENINRLREEFDVDIQLQDGKCEIKGPEAKANAAKKHILDMGRKLEDEKTYIINVPAQYHRDLIGAKGSQVERLQSRYGVRVNFPRARQADDAASEAGDRGSQQGANEVVIKGPSRGADACRDELLSLLQYVKDNSHSATVSVAQNQLPSLIGAGGREMEALRLETSAQIDVPNSRETANPDGRAEIKLKGSKQAVEAAKKAIEAKSKEFDNTITRTLDVDRKHHRVIIGSGGSNLRNIITQAGGPDEPRLHNRIVRFPKTDAEGNGIRVEGQKVLVDRIVTAIESLVSQQESQKTEIAEVNPEKHRLLIGRGGEKRRELEQQFNVQINVPRQTETGPARSQVKIAGQPEDVEKAKTHILEITKDQEGETVNIPRRFHHAIADNGQFFRRLRNDHKVTVDHSGQRPPPKPSTPTASRSAGTGATPLITDEPGAAANTPQWKTHDLHSSGDDGEIPWVLSGSSPEAIQAARAKLEKALEDAKKQDTMGFLILPDPRAYRHVIGPGGSEINRIRKQTGTKIQVPKDQNSGEAIEITGTKDGVEEAKNIILEIVANNS
ncbi:RNA-binding G protein effector of mating response pathway [Teratosphaeria nubilosa]|uniref:RNA-binding G protein effector of mating response pathway n=1 Tax=Teratosphaeria nubilosa TaxID=161662 RepID=A0A6G1KUG2_9PEZI|nr:RNA-binding G protein effector of mating response pathway [Teratosphaeria nubilosa]